MRLFRAQARTRDDGVIGMAPPLQEPLAEVDEGDGDSVEERADTGYGVSSEGGQV